MRSRESIPLTLPRATKPQRAGQLENLGYHNSLVPEGELEVSNYLFDESQSPRKLSEDADQTNPFYYTLPRTTNPQRAKQLERIGYLNAFVGESE